MTGTYALLLLTVAIAFLIFGIRAWIKMFKIPNQKSFSKHQGQD